MNVSDAIRELEKLPQDSILLVWGRGGWLEVLELEGQPKALPGGESYVLIHENPKRPFDSGGR